LEYKWNIFSVNVPGNAVTDLWETKLMIRGIRTRFADLVPRESDPNRDKSHRENANLISMELEYKIIESAHQFEEFQKLLKASDLRADDLDFKRDLLVGYYEGNSLVGTGGLEIRGDHALLRSLSVKMGIRGNSVGTTITEFLIDEARKKNLKDIYLLTERAKGFFEKKGFQEISKDSVPDQVQGSSEFLHLNPDSACVMKLQL
jgi:amino-acid N-acetyltransferase